MIQTFTEKTNKILLMAMFALCCGTAVAQSVQGVVTDSTGNYLAGVNIIVKGTTSGTTTDANGAYVIASDQLTSGSVLIFSFIGYRTQEIALEGKTVINISLSEDEATLNEVVVTALGIRREEKALGYATQTLRENQMLDARSNNWAGALSGKIAGLSLISTGSGPLNSTRIKLRGDNSLNPGKNNALIILDGVPMNSGMVSSGVTNAYGAGSGNDVPIDFGNGIADINPDDIETISVLKGANAAALYGSRGSNGVIIITTKSGKRGKGLGITINSNYAAQDVLKWPDYQYEYGQGTGRAFNTDGKLYYSYGASPDGASTGGTSSAFGPRFDGQLYYQYDPTTEGPSTERLPWRPYEDNIKGFWGTGSTFTNSIALEGGSEESNARVSITHSKNEWMMPNTGFERINAALSLNHAISKRIKLGAKVNFTNKKSDNLPATGYNNQSIAYFMIFQNPNVDLNWYRPIWKNNKYQVDQVHPFSSFIDNPYLIAYEMTNALNNNSIAGNLSATYTLSDKWEVMVRSALSWSRDERRQKRPYSTANFQKGYYKEQDVFFSEVNTDGLLSYTDKIGSHFDVKVSVGANNRHVRSRSTDAYVEGLVIPGVYKLTNGVNSPMVATLSSEKIVNSVFAFANFSYDDKIFIDVTGRNDWSSTLPSQSNSFFYPSISTSLIMSEIFQLPSVISFSKIRLSAAQVGNDTDPYQTSKYYGRSEFPGSGSVATTLFNANLKPENTTSYEAGIENIFFNRRLSIDVALYRNITENQILEVPMDPTTGYTAAVLNAGEVRNQGIELVLGGTPIQSQNFKWTSTVTWSKNHNRVLSLAEGLTDRQDIGYGGNATITATVGGTTGDIYGFGFKRAPDGQIIYNSTGLPDRPAATQYIGNAYADWKGGFQNEFSYRNIRLSVLFDGQYGGIVYSQTHHKMTEQGKLKHTLMGREDGYIIGEGVVDNGDGTYSPNTKQVNIADYYADYYRRANVESNSFDASFIKLREVRLEYKLSPNILSRTPIREVSIAFYGRDLAMITDFPIFDPETAALNGSTILPGVEMGQLPTPRTYGVNLTLKL
jgi:TonB-linked SusC/RagA family outer membrane protein